LESVGQRGACAHARRTGLRYSVRTCLVTPTPCVWGCCTSMGSSAGQASPGTDCGDQFRSNLVSLMLCCNEKRIKALRWCEKLAWHSQSGSCLKVSVENAGMVLPKATVHRQKRRWRWGFSYRARIYKFRHSDVGMSDDGGETFSGEICGGICYCSDWRD
jgi:hypothetical protein